MRSALFILVIREEVNEFYKQKQILKKKQEDENLREIRYRNEIG